MNRRRTALFVALALLAQGSVWAGAPAAPQPAPKPDSHEQCPDEDKNGERDERTAPCDDCGAVPLPGDIQLV